MSVVLSIENELVVLSKDEQDAYDSVEAQVRKTSGPFSEYVNSAVWHLLQACYSPDLCLLNCAQRVSPAEFQLMMLEKQQDDDKLSVDCSFCRVLLQKRDVQRMKFSQEEEGPSANNMSSSKIAALLNLLQNSRTINHCGKSVVLSQYKIFLLTACEVLTKAGFQSRCTAVFDDDDDDLMSKTVEEFSKSEHDVVLLTTFSAVIVTPGFDLSAVSNVFMMEPCWHASCERKTLNRIHQPGKNDALNVVRFVSRNTIEERLLNMRNGKRDIKQLLGLN